MPEPCIHDLDPAACAVCNGAEKRASDRDSPELGPWFFASWGGVCSGCGDEFESGQKIRADGRGGYLSECCS